MLNLSPEVRAMRINELPSGLDRELGVVYITVGEERVVAEMTVGEQHLQPFGLVHGGVYCALAESTCSAGAAMVVMHHGLLGVGISNDTRFIAAARAGSVLRVTAEPQSIQGHHHTWRARIEDGDRLCAVGTVVVRALSADHPVAGAVLELPSGARNQ